MTENPALSRMRARGQNDLNVEELLIAEPLTASAVVDAIYADTTQPNPETMDSVVKDMLEDPTGESSMTPEDIEVVEKDAGALQGPLQGDESKGGAMASPGVRGRYKLVRTDKTKKSKKKSISKNIKQYVSPRPLTVGERVKWAYRLKPYGVGTTIKKDKDGLRLAYIVSSNSYQDRETEWVTTKALKAYVEKSWNEEECNPQNLYLFWHSADAIGDIVWTDMQGPFLIEVAKERPNGEVNIAREGQEPVYAKIKEVWDYIEENPDKHDWGASQGFKASPKEVISKSYKDIRKFETSTLPLEKAANAYTFTGVIDMVDRDQILENITGVKGSAKQVKNLRKGVSRMDEILQNLGIRHKSLGDEDVDISKGIIEDLTETVEDFLGDIIDGDKEVIKEVAPEVVEAIMQTLAGDKNKKRKKEDSSKENQGAGDADDKSDDDEDDAGTGSYRKEGYSYASPDASLRPITKQMKLLDTLVATQEGIVEGMGEIRKDMKAVRKLKNLPVVLENLERRLEDVEKSLKLRPKAISQDTAGGSVVDSGDGSLIAAIEKQLTQKDDFFGVHVRPQ